MALVGSIACVPDPRAVPLDGDVASFDGGPASDLTGADDLESPVAVSATDGPPVLMDGPSPAIDTTPSPVDAPVSIDAAPVVTIPPPVDAPSSATCASLCPDGCQQLVCRELATQALSCGPADWDFESGTTEGWISSGRASGVGAPTAVPGHSHGGNYALAQTIHSGDAIVALAVDLCGGTTGRAAIRGRTVSLWYFFDRADLPAGGATVGVSLYQDSENMRATPVPLVAQQWTQLSDTLGASLSDGDDSPRIGFTLLGRGAPTAYEATVYVDDVTIE